MRVVNFAPGPTQLPKKVINNISNIINKNNPLEISHRSKEFIDMFNLLNEKIKKYMNIDNNFEILWTHGGATGQFSSIPINMKSKKANYIHKGSWSNTSFLESKKFINSYQSILVNNDYKSVINDDDHYLYICSNETVEGIEFKNKGLRLPYRNELNNTKLVVDMSSDFTMKKINWNNIDIAFSSSSKNIGTAGSCITIVRKELIKKNKEIPKILNWYEYSRTNSLFNTINVFNIYLINEMFNYYINNITIEEQEHLSIYKAKLVYEFLENSIKFNPLVFDSFIRSNINIPFNVKNREKFIKFCSNHGIYGLNIYSNFNKNLRISLYNSISINDTKYLIDIMYKYDKL